MARSPKAKLDGDRPEKSQAERFKEAARRIGVDETGENFEKAFAKIVSPKTPNRKAGK